MQYNPIELTSTDWTNVSASLPLGQSFAVQNKDVRDVLFFEGPEAPTSDAPATLLAPRQSVDITPNGLVWLRSLSGAALLAVTDGATFAGAGAGAGGGTGGGSGGDGGGGGSGTDGVTEHGLLSGRADADQHPLAAITGLRAELDALFTLVQGMGTHASAVFVGKWELFRQDPLPQGWLALDGALVEGARARLPELVAYLTLRPGECITEEDWQAKSVAASGTGGVGFYVYDAAADTLRMPDVRGDSWYAGDVAGKWRGDAMRNIIGTFQTSGTAALIQFASQSTASGAFQAVSSGTQYTFVNSATKSNAVYIGFNSSKSVPTDSVNHPRQLALTPAVFVGRFTPASA